MYGICTRNQFARAPHRLGRAYFSDKSAFLLFFGGGCKGKKGTVTIMKKVAVIMGSASDLAVAEKATARLASLGIEYEAHVYSAHRTPVEARDFVLHAEENGFGVIIALAGMAAHLAGALAAGCTLPVIGVPVKSSNLSGVDALLSTVQMPTGIPVATVAIDGAANAALLAAQILALSDGELSAKLKKLRAVESAAVLEKDREIAAKLNG